MSFYSFWILKKICLVPLYHLMQDVHHIPSVVPRATTSHKTKNIMINKKLKVLLGAHFEIVGEEKILSIRVQRRATHW